MPAVRVESGEASCLSLLRNPSIPKVGYPLLAMPQFDLPMVAHAARNHDRVLLSWGSGLGEFQVSSFHRGKILLALCLRPFRWPAEHPVRTILCQHGLSWPRYDENRADLKAMAPWMPWTE